MQIFVIQNIKAMTYGNILSKTGLGAYTYGSARPHAVTGVENTGYVIQSAAQHIDYNPWGKASRIEEGQYSQTLRYGPDRQRWKVVDIVGNAASLGNAAFGAKLGWDWENLTLTSAGGLGDKLYPPDPYINARGEIIQDNTGFTINSIMGNSNLSGVYSHELHHLWQQRAMLKHFYYNYVLNGLTSLMFKGDFINRYNVYEDIANNKLFWH